MARKLGYFGALKQLVVAVSKEGVMHRSPTCQLGSYDNANAAQVVPVCIVGHVFYQIDPIKFVAVKPFGQVRKPAVSLGIELTKSAVGLLGRAQFVQDSVNRKGQHYTWGHAVLRAVFNPWIISIGV